MFKRLILLCIISVGSLSAIKNPAAVRPPIVFHPDYDISFGWFDALHSFDGKKYGKVHAYLQEKGIKEFYSPEPITDEKLIELKIHTPEYLKKITSSTEISRIIEVPLSIAPNWLLQRWLLNPMRLATGGTVLATELSLVHKWAINLAGGYHHAKCGEGGGFCFFADIPLAIKIILQTNPTYKVLIVDLDAHQGNGHETVCGTDEILKTQVFIFDMYNARIYPRDKEAEKFITFKHALTKPAQWKDEGYLAILKQELPLAIAQVQPNLIVYNAGTDILDGDPLGGMMISEKGVIERDAFVFTCAINNNIPIVMVLSGGYTAQSADVIGKSAENLLRNVIPGHILPILGG